ncbi:MAG: Maf family protein [Acidimicrobiales bacterium]
MTAPQLVLASGSPRRRELLERVGLRFAVRVPDVDEDQRPHEDPAAYVTRLAADKALAVLQRWNDAEAGPAVVVGADTTVELDGRCLGKPADADDAAVMLARLSGRTHCVLTGVAVLTTTGHTERFALRTEVRMVPLSAAAIDWYVATGEPFDKAGAYAIQGAGGAFVAAIVGSYSNVVGLPLAETLHALQRAGLAGVPGR